MKKLLITSAITAAALAAMPAFASVSCCDHDNDTCCPKIEIDNTNLSKIGTFNVTLANSGRNSIDLEGGDSNVAVISTGAATSISSIGITTGGTLASVVVPTTGTVDVDNFNLSKVRTMNLTKANSGLNQIGLTGGANNGVSISTGAAGAQSSIGVVTGNSITTVGP